MNDSGATAAPSSAGGRTKLGAERQKLVQSIRQERQQVALNHASLQQMRLTPQVRQDVDRHRPQARHKPQRTAYKWSQHEIMLAIQGDCVKFVVKRMKFSHIYVAINNSLIVYICFKFESDISAEIL